VGNTGTATVVRSARWPVRVGSLASLVVLARDNGLPESTGRRAVRAGLRSYRGRMSHYASARVLDIWYGLVTADDLLQQVFEPEELERVSARLDKRAKRRTSAGAAPKLPRLVDGRLRIIEDPPIRVRLKDEDSLATTTAFRTTGAICWTNSPSSTWFDRSSGWAVSVWRSIWCCCRGAAPTIRCSCRSNRPDHRCTNPT
jgi:Uncharacterized protein conserved in bacteria (DUF2252)